VKTVLVKIQPEGEQMGFEEHIRLRKWCHENVKCTWNSLFLDKPDEILTRHAAFQFESENEAMKFKLYSG
jgi:hypothetical protein